MQSEVERLVDESVELMGGIDIVVSNAVYSDRHLMLESDLDEFRKTIDVSMWGAFYFVRAAAQKMVEAGNGGNIVVISSPHAHMAIPGAMAYNMAKAANDQMAQTAACELAQHRIRVNIIHPGWTDTPGERKFFYRRNACVAKARSCRGDGSANRKRSAAASSSFATRPASTSPAARSRSTAESNCHGEKCTASMRQPKLERRKVTVPVAVGA